MNAGDQFRHAMSEECSCAICERELRGMSREQAFADMAEFDRKCLEERGYYIHYVPDDEDTLPGVNAHTHGLATFNHYDFQIVLRIPPATVQVIFGNLAERVKKGEVFAEFGRYDDVIKGFFVAVIPAYDNDRKVLRVVLPEEDGELMPFEMTIPEFKAQWTVSRERKVTA